MIQPFKFLKNYVTSINQNGGPKEEDYFELEKWGRLAWEHKPSKPELWDIFGPEITDPATHSLFSGILNMPRGYHGSFDIMETFYNDTINPTLTPLQFRWDAYILSQVCCLAVRHRMDVVRSIAAASQGEPLSFLDVACGSGRAYLTLRSMLKKDALDYKGIDQDPEAIKFCVEKFGSESFEVGRFLGITMEKVGLHDTVWCSGLFDYIAGDEAFRGAAKRLIAVAKKRVIIGNMGPYNPSRPMMELLGWRLVYRTRQKLEQLGKDLIDSGAGVKAYAVMTDPTLMQHYLHLEIA